MTKRQILICPSEGRTWRLEEREVSRAGPIVPGGDQLRLAQAFPPPLRIIALVTRIVAAEYQVSVEDMLSDIRKGKVLRARQVVMWLAWVSTRGDPKPVSTSSIGLAMSRDHSTVTCAVQRIGLLRKKDLGLLKLTNDLLARVQEERAAWGQRRKERAEVAA